MGFCYVKPRASCVCAPDDEFGEKKNKLQAALNKKSQKQMKDALEDFESLLVTEELKQKERELVDRSHSHQKFLNVRDRMALNLQ